MTLDQSGTLQSPGWLAPVTSRNRLGVACGMWLLYEVIIQMQKQTKKQRNIQKQKPDGKRQTKKQRNQQPPLHLYHTKALPRSYRHLFQLFFQDSVTASDVVHSELQEDLSENFSEFGR